MKKVLLLLVLSGNAAYSFEARCRVQLEKKIEQIEKNSNQALQLQKLKTAIHILQGVRDWIAYLCPRCGIRNSCLAYERAITCANPECEHVYPPGALTNDMTSAAVATYQKHKHILCEDSEDDRESMSKSDSSADDTEPFEATTPKKLSVGDFGYEGPGALLEEIF